MARGNKRRGRGGRQGGGGRAPKDDTFRDDILDKSDMHNERFEAYYKAQDMVPEDEWDAFMDALRRPLPTTFRVAGSRQVAQELNVAIRDTYVPTLSDCVFEGEHVPPPVQIPWYPDGLAWQFNVPKKVLRKSPEFKKFHSFLVFETEVGNVSRQEAVSMLPPLFLDVEPHHLVIDMCAAPGSKTAQLLEALHARDTATATSVPLGLLVANDSDSKRTHLLIHQSARLPSPALLVTNLDASIYPVLKIPAPGAGTSGRQQQVLFDRILCDVPCSGDGTLRKNIGIWTKWGPSDGNGLHGLQVRILQRAMRMLKDGGRIVYSTCSLNPIENEAVVATALKSIPGFELIDVSDKLPQLVRRPGLTKWRPAASKTAREHDTYEGFLASEDSRNTKMTEGHWPPADAEALGLTRCLRIYPHLQDTGGFFVAVIQSIQRTPVTGAEAPAAVDSAEKKREGDEIDDAPESKKPRLAEEDKEVTPAALEQTKATTETPPTALRNSEKSGKGKEKKDHGGSFKENPYTFLAPDDPILHACIERLQLTSEFPSSNVLVRNPEGDAVRSLYLTNDIVKTIVQHNDYARLRLTAAGTKVFTKQEAGRGIDAQFRILGEGLPVVLPYIEPAAIMEADAIALRVLVQTYYPLCASFAEPFKTELEARPAGCHVVRFVPTNGDHTLSRELLLPIWKSNVSVTLMIDKKAKSAMSLRLFGEDITTSGREAAGKKAAAAGTASASAEVAAEVADEVNVTDEKAAEDDVNIN